MSLELYVVLLDFHSVQSITSEYTLNNINGKPGYYLEIYSKDGRVYEKEKELKRS